MIKNSSYIFIFLFLFRSPYNNKLFVVAEDHSALKQSLDQLNLFSEDNPPSAAPVRLLLLNQSKFFLLINYNDIPANFSWVKSTRFFSQRMPGFPKMTRPCPKISEDIRSISEHVRSISEDVSNVSGSSPRTCFAEHDLVPNAFLVKT